LVRSFGRASRLPENAPQGGDLKVYAEGGNYRFEIDDRLVTCRVWSRPDVDRLAGAAFANEKVEHFDRLTALPRAIVVACLFDLREAPKSWGPITQSALERSVALWERAGRRIAVVTSDDALQLFHLRLLLSTHAPTQSKLFTNVLEARAWLEPERSLRGSPIE
jgi:hypothetical protein